MQISKLGDTYKRIRTLQTHKISALPVVILMPHSACNCRCVMCDIWKDNKNLKQLNENDIIGLLSSLKQFGTKHVAMSGGEALLNHNFFTLCSLLKKQGIKISLLSTGLTIKKHAVEILEYIDDLIVSLDGDSVHHDTIRNIPKAFDKLKEGVEYINSLNPSFKITGRTVIHQQNFRNWQSIITEGKGMGLKQISFLPADVSSHAFNRQIAWSEPKKDEILIHETELGDLKQVIEAIIKNNTADIKSGFIAESAEKLEQIYLYYAAFWGQNPFPFKKCNAPWVSTVIEADGTVRPCFFHQEIGNIHNSSLATILNSEKAFNFRKMLNTSKNDTCVKCVCSLNLSPFTKLL